MKHTLATMRVAKGLKQKDVATLLGVSTGALRSWEKGQTSPTIDKALKLCSIYQCNLDDIFFISHLAKS